MIEVAYCKLCEPAEKIYYPDYFSLLPEFVIEKIKNFRQPEDKSRTLIGYLLLLNRLMAKGYKQKALVDMARTPTGKPYLSGFPEFNISHSGDYCTAAISDATSVGIDIEQRVDITAEELAAFLTEAELLDINSSSDPQSRLFEIWSVKEAGIKADGRGFTADISQVSIYKNNSIRVGDQLYIYQEIDIAAGYSCHLAYLTKKAGSKRLQIKVNELDLEELLSLL